MVVGSTYNLNTKSRELSNVISIDSNLVSRVPSNKCLGVLLDEKLTFETHIDYICNKRPRGLNNGGMIPSKGEILKIIRNIFSSPSSDNTY